MLFNILWSSVCLAQGPTAFPLEQYLHQVQQTNQGYLGSQASSRGASDAAKEAALLFSPQFITHLEYSDDRAPTFAPDIEGKRTVKKTTALGFAKQFDFGLKTQLLYNFREMTRYGSAQAFVPDPSQYINGVYFSFTQPFWQNAFGRMNRATSRALEAADHAKAYGSAFQAKQTIADAEARYWKLAVARELVRIQQESTARAMTIRDFNVRKLRRHLGDVSDVLTSDAAVQGKKLELKSARDDERVASRAFNSARSIDSDTVNERLELPHPDLVQDLAVPVRAENRDDVNAAERAQVAAAANNEIVRELQLPSLNLEGDTTFKIAINLVIPLNQGATSSVRAAYAQQTQGAELIYQRKLFEQESDWKDLVTKFKEAKERLAIAVRLERAQQAKFQNVKKRQVQGLTITYQVFQYELDYLGSELNRVQLEGLILMLLAQMKTYRSGP